MISRVRIVVNAKSGRTFDVDGVYNYANSVVLVVNSNPLLRRRRKCVYNYDISDRIVVNSLFENSYTHYWRLQLF